MIVRHHGMRFSLIGLLLRGSSRKHNEALVRLSVQADFIAMGADFLDPLAQKGRVGEQAPKPGRERRQHRCR